MISPNSGGSFDLSPKVRSSYEFYTFVSHRPGEYGEKIHKTFRMKRQGVRRWFQRLFNHIYVEAFETILMIEKTFGTQLREYAIRIIKERYEFRREVQQSGFRSAGDMARQ